MVVGEDFATSVCLCFACLMYTDEQQLGRRGRRQQAPQDVIHDQRPPDVPAPPSQPGRLSIPAAAAGDRLGFKLAAHFEKPGELLLAKRRHQPGQLGPAVNRSAEWHRWSC